MPITGGSQTPNMGLTKWGQLTDAYDHNQLAGNFALIDLHDHTSGKGVQIPNGGLAPGAVDGDALADNSITSDHILNGTIQKADLSTTLLNLLCPIGTVVAWYRPSTSVDIPDGWEVLDGRTWASIPNDFGVSSGTIPDARNKFLLGAADSTVDTVGTGTGTPPEIGATGLTSHTASMSHTHTIPSHTHSIPAHDHRIPTHTHNVNDHNHFIGSDGAHSHTFASGKVFSTRPNTPLPGDGSTPSAPLAFIDASTNLRTFNLQSTFIGGLTAPTGESVTAPMDAVANHNHGGVTGGAAGLTTAGINENVRTTENPTLTTDGTALTTASGGSSIDIRPAYVGLLYIMKVKWS